MPGPTLKKAWNHVTGTWEDIKQDAKTVINAAKNRKSDYEKFMGKKK